MTHLCHCELAKQSPRDVEIATLALAMTGWRGGDRRVAACDDTSLSLRAGEAVPARRGDRHAGARDDRMASRGSPRWR